MYPYNRKLRNNAQELRKNMTPEEKHLWYDFLKKLPITVKRQKQIENFIIDFYIASAKLAIEIDGIQHTLPEHEDADRKRDETLHDWGIKVIRYSNVDINARFDTVINDILDKLGLSADSLKEC